MELYQLKTFITVAKEAHLTRAAERLFISQPAVSAHIKSLEEELGVILFERTPKGMRLTREGEALLDQAERILQSVADFRNQAAVMREEVTGAVTLGVHIDPDLLKIAEFLLAMAAGFPGVSLRLVQSMSWETLRAVKNEEIDAGFIYGENPHPEITAIPLHDFNLVVAGPSQWKDRIKGADWETLAKLPWIWTPVQCPFHRIANSLFEKQNLKPQTVAVSDQESVLMTLVSSGLGITLMIEEEAQRAERLGKVSVWEQVVGTIRLSFVYLQRRQKDPVFKAVLQGLSTAWKLEGTAGRP